MIIAIVGHRHSNALFRLRRWDFDLGLGAANIADKMSDPAHLRRLVGLGSQVARQNRAISPTPRRGEQTARDETFT
ncbi:MAG: hypothetical protein U5L08_07280 [Xanthomonadales bacterium]|nr:hypothetical protein [Xanthomonadales bacterium]